MVLHETLLRQLLLKLRHLAAILPTTITVRQVGSNITEFALIGKPVGYEVVALLFDDKQFIFVDVAASEMLYQSSCVFYHVAIDELGERRPIIKTFLDCLSTDGRILTIFDHVCVGCGFNFFCDAPQSLIPLLFCFLLLLGPTYFLLAW